MVLFNMCYVLVGFEVLTTVSTKMAVFWVGKLLPDYTALQPRRQPSVLCFVFICLHSWTRIYMWYIFMTTDSFVHPFREATFWVMSSCVFDKLGCAAGEKRLRNTALQRKKRSNINETQRINLCEIWGPHGGEDDDVVLLDCDAVWTRRSIPKFRRNMLSTYPLPINPTSALKMETVCFSEALVWTYESTRRHNPGEQHRHLNLVFWIVSWYKIRLRSARYCYFNI
jgi:hypothetical protein